MREAWASPAAADCFDLPSSTSSSEPRRARDLRPFCPGDDGSDSARDALTGQREPPDSDGGGHDRHRAQLQGSDGAALDAEAHPVAPAGTSSSA